MSAGRESGPGPRSWLVGGRACRFETSRVGHPLRMRTSGSAAPGIDPGPDATTLVFVGRRHCGASRRMESLVAWVKVTQKKRLRVLDLDADRNPRLAYRLG